MVSKFKGVAALFAAAALASACGGGGSSGGDSGSNNNGTPAPPPPAETSQGAPVIVAQPANASVLTDAPATFSVAASGTGLSYQWQRNNVAIAGATSASYTTPGAGWQDSGAAFKVVVSNDKGSVTSTAAQLDLQLSAGQQAYERLALAPSASYRLVWNLNSAGAQVSGTNYAYSESSALAQSPLTHGPQLLTAAAAENMTTTLALPAAAVPTRVLKDGVILVVPDNVNRIRYAGSDVLSESLAADGSTVGFTLRRSNQEWVDLSGNLKAATPLDLQHITNSYFTNPAVLKNDAVYAAGAAYLKSTSTTVGDRVNAFDCRTPAPGNAQITACETGKKLEDLLTTGYSSTSDLRSYTLADGAISTVEGVRMWIASMPRPNSASMSSTVQYRVYFEMNGNVYTGAFIKDGTVVGGGYYISMPGAATIDERLTFLPFSVRLNQAARDSLKAGLTL